MRHSVHKDRHGARSLVAGLMMLVVAAPVCAQNAPAQSTLVERPLILQQKWVAGQQLEYEVLMDGAANLHLPADADVLGMLSGALLEMNLRLKAQTTVNTLAVDEFGQGKVALRVGQISLKGQAFGQNGELELRRGRGQLMLNGQPLGEELYWPILDQPDSALLISRRGHLEGFVKLRENVPEPATSPDQAKSPINYLAMLQATILRALPSLWPSRPVKIGESWIEEIGRAPLPRAAGQDVLPRPNREAPGKIKFTLQGEEEVAGRKAHRIALEGQVMFDRRHLQEAVEALPEEQRDATSENVKWLNQVHQNISGTLWFDPSLGHIVRAEVLLNSQLQSRTGTKGGEKQPGEWSDFHGTLQLQLKNVMQSALANAPAF